MCLTEGDSYYRLQYFIIYYRRNIMNFIGKISDIDIGEEEKMCENPNTRIAVRVILINDANKIAILHKKK